MTDLSDLPEPLVPDGVDLRGLAYMPLLGARLFNSDFDLEASDAEFRRGLMLWWAAWNQQPAASLPNSDRALAKLAGFEDEKSPAWKKVKKRALHGFIECNDGRLYHPIIAHQAMIAWEKRVADADERENKLDRKQRERDDRKRMFAELRAVGVVPEWKIGTGELRRIYAERITPADRTPPAAAVTTPVPGHDDESPPVTVTGHVTEPVTVTPNGTAWTGRDGTGIEIQERCRPTEPSRKAPADDFVPANWEAWRLWWDAEQGIEHDPLSVSDRKKLRPLAEAWCKAGITVGQMRAAVEKAYDEAKEPIAYLPAYVDRVLASLTAAAAGPKPSGRPEWRQRQLAVAAELTGAPRREPGRHPHPRSKGEVIDV